MSATTSVSLAEARELYRLLVECESKLNNLETQSLETRVSLNELYTLSTDVLRVLQNLGLGEDVEVAITRVQRLITTLNMLRITILALEATTPIGLLLATIGGITSLISIGETLNDEFERSRRK